MTDHGPDDLRVFPPDWWVAVVDDNHVAVVMAPDQDAQGIGVVLTRGQAVELARYLALAAHMATRDTPGQRAET